MLSQSSTVTSTRPVDTHIIKLQTSNRQQIQDNTQGIIQKYNQEDRESASVFMINNYYTCSINISINMRNTITLYSPVVRAPNAPK